MSIKQNQKVSYKKFLGIAICRLLKIVYYKSPIFKSILKKLYFNSLKYYFWNDPFTPYNYIIWTGGYDYTGDVTDKNNLNYFDDQGVKLYDIYRNCIMNYINHNTIALEIGPGVGDFTKPIIKEARFCYLVDALSLSRNNILTNLDFPENIKYIQAYNFNLDEIPDYSIDYFFSFQTFNFIPIYGVEQYLSNLYTKAKVGFHGFVGISDNRKNDSCCKEFWPGFQTMNNSFKTDKILQQIGFTVYDNDYLKLKKESIVYFGKEQ